MPPPKLVAQHLDGEKAKIAEWNDNIGVDWPF